MTIFLQNVSSGGVENKCIVLSPYLCIFQSIIIDVSFSKINKPYNFSNLKRIFVTSPFFLKWFDSSSELVICIFGVPYIY